jgi:NADPH-dependent glutamate synthase beta subunit-like oxidoreductase
MTKKFSGVETRVAELQCCQVEWMRKNGSWELKELAGTDFTLKADIVLLAMGFLHVTHNGLIKGLNLKLDDFGNISVDNYQTSEAGIFAAGDTVTGASSVVKAINNGREAAIAIDDWL